MKCTHNDCGVCYAVPIDDTSSISGMCDTPQDCPMYVAQQVKTLAEQIDVELSIKQPSSDMLRDYFGLDVEQYRILEEGEIIKEGDEFEYGLNDWRKHGILHGNSHGCGILRTRRPIANEYNIAASMEPVSPIDATANAPSEWADHAELFAMAPLDATHICGGAYWKEVREHLFKYDCCSWMDRFIPNFRATAIEIPPQERELNRLADLPWEQTAGMNAGTNGTRVFSYQEHEARRALRHSEPNTPEKMDSSPDFYQPKTEYKEKMTIVRGEPETEIPVAQYQSWSEVPDDLKYLAERIDEWSSGRRSKNEPIQVFRTDASDNGVGWRIYPLEEELNGYFTRAQWQNARTLYEQIDKRPQATPEEMDSPEKWIKENLAIEDWPDHYFVDLNSDGYICFTAINGNGYTKADIYGNAPEQHDASEILELWYPEKCPVTFRPFFMTIEHPELGMVPTYGGPYDSYTIPQPTNLPETGNSEFHDIELGCQRFDHDEGGWLIDETHIVDQRITTEDRLMDFGAWDKPEVEPEAWNGEGLPPVGAECEFQTNGRAWRSCSIEFIGDSSLVIRNFMSQMWVKAEHVKFRPINAAPTAAEIEAEAREIAVKKICDFWWDKVGRFDEEMAEALYDDGRFIEIAEPKESGE